MSCGEPRLVAMTAPAASEDRCPKCHHGKSAASPQACARCGLVFARWDPRTADVMAELDEQGERLWQDAVQSWQDAAAHDAFLKHCSVAGLLPAAGRRYRERLDAHPADAVADKMQKRVVGMAMALLGAPAQKPPAPFTRSTAFWLILLSALFIGIIGALMFRR